MDVLRRSLVGITVVGLAIDAYVHIKLAGDYDGGDFTITEGTLFRIEAAMAVIAAILLLVRPNRITAGIAAAVAGGGTFALLFYYFFNPGQIGPLPPMHEPLMFTDKAVTLIAQAIATATALVLVVIGGRQRQDEP